MRLLLDTHTLLWFLAGDDHRFSDQTRYRIADRGNEVLASTVSFWEIAIKSRLGKIKADPSQVARQAAQVGSTTLMLHTTHVAALTAVQRFDDHKDPFDHMLVAQALTERATLVSQDAPMGRYSVPLLRCK